jgi:hypothetical protein
VSEIKHRTVETNGIHIQPAESGAGPLVALCHGFPEYVPSQSCFWSLFVRFWTHWCWIVPELNELGQLGFANS